MLGRIGFSVDRTVKEVDRTRDRYDSESIY